MADFTKSPFPICSIKLLKLLKFHWTFRFWLTFVIFDWFWSVFWGFWLIWACRMRWEVWFWQIFIRFRCPWRHFLRILAEVPWRFPESPWKSLITHYFLFFLNFNDLRILGNLLHGRWCFLCALLLGLRHGCSRCWPRVRCAWSNPSGIDLREETRCSTPHLGVAAVE